MPLAKQSFRVTSQRGRSNMPHTISASQQWRYQHSEHCHFRASMGPKMDWMNHINTPLIYQKINHITGIYQMSISQKMGWMNHIAMERHNAWISLETQRSQNVQQNGACTANVPEPPLKSPPVDAPGTLLAVPFQLEHLTPGQTPNHVAGDE